MRKKRATVSIRVSVKARKTLNLRAIHLDTTVVDLVDSLLKK